jgi:transcriptional regulator with XRE-family HTH domain
MAKVRPTRDWGAILRQLRQTLGMSGADVVARLKVLGVTLDRRTLYTYEAGRVRSPDAAVVWGLARIYGADLEDLIMSLVSNRNAPTARAAEVRTSKPRELLRDDSQLIQLFQNLPAETKAEVEEFIQFHISRSRTRRRLASKARHS